MNASSMSFQTYISGVYDDENCTSDEGLNHAMVLVGFGTEEGGDYWIAKNEWGGFWGEKGYIRIAIKPGSGICGIQENATWTVMA